MRCAVSITAAGSMLSLPRRAPPSCLRGRSTSSDRLPKSSRWQADGPGGPPAVGQASRVAPRVPPHLRRRCAIAAAEGVIEIRQVAEAGFERNAADWAASKARIGERPVHARQPLVKDEFGVGDPFAFE